MAERGIVRRVALVIGKKACFGARVYAGATSPADGGMHGPGAPRHSQIFERGSAGIFVAGLMDCGIFFNQSPEIFINQVLVEKKSKPDKIFSINARLIRISFPAGVAIAMEIF